MKNATVSDPGGGQDPKPQIPAASAKTQWPFVCLPRTRTAGAWLGEGTPLTPILLRNGHALMGNRVQETWPDTFSGEVSAFESPIPGSGANHASHFVYDNDH